VDNFPMLSLLKRSRFHLMAYHIPHKDM